MGEAMLDPSIILWSGSLSNRDVVGSVTMIVNIIIITMYKYTYLLSQSYRSESGIERGREVAGVGARKDLGNVEVGLKVMPKNVVNRKE